MANEQHIIIGKFGSAHGIKGFVKVNSFTDPADNILDYQPWQVKFAGKWQEVKYIKAEVRPKFYAVQMQECISRNDAEKYVNCEIAIFKSQLAKLSDEEYYWHELKNMRVITQKNEDLGCVCEIMQTGANDVLIVKGEKKHLIPFLLEQYIISIDRDKKVIVVDWDVDF